MKKDDKFHKKGVRINQINPTYKAAFDNSFDAITIYTEDGEFIDCNERAVEMFQMDNKDEFRSVKPAYLSPEYQPDGRKSEDIAKEYVQEILKSGTYLKFEWQHKRKNGQLFPTRIILTSYKLGDILVRQATIHDITNEKKRETTEKHLKDVLAAIRNVNQLITKENDAQNLIKEACRLLTEDVQYYGAWIALLNDGKVESVACSGKSSVFCELEQKLFCGEYPQCMKKVLSAEHIVITRDKQTNCSQCPLFPKSYGKAGLGYRLSYQNKLYGIISVSVPIEYADLKEEQELFREVADDLGFALHKIEQYQIQKVIQSSLKERERQLSSVISTLPGFVYRCRYDENWTMIYVSEQCEEITGYTPEELIDNKQVAFNNMILKEHRTRLFEEWQKVLSIKAVFESEYRILTKDGTEKLVWERGTGVFDKQGNLLFIEGYIKDISQRKQMEMELIASKDRYEKQRNSIAKLAMNEYVMNGDVEKAVKLITEVAAKTIGVNQASLWVLSDDQRELNCLDLYDSDDRQHSFGKSLHTEEFPDYFIALKKEKQIVAADAQHDPRTIGLAKSYLIPENITSLLDSSIWKNDVVGVLCLEHKGKMRKWQPDEQNFSRILAMLFMQTVSTAEKNKAEEELRKSEIKFRSLVQHNTDIIALYSPDGTVLYKSPGLKQILGFEPEEVVGYNVMDMVYPPDKERAMHLFANMFSIPLGEHITFEIRALHKDGSFRWLVATITNMTNEPTVMAFIGNYRDITGSKEAREKIERSLQEKTTLIKEIHHRVKNNLQIISSMINLQVTNMACEQDKGLMLDVRNRIRAIALVHEKVYQSNSLDRIDARGYIQEIARQLQMTFGSKEKTIQLDVTVENVMFSVDEAVPCALIINELITNSFKYAFEGRKQGVIKVHFVRENDCYHLLIADDGIGMSEHIDMQNPESLGLKIVSGLVHQLEGSIILNNEEGVSYKIIFKL